MSDNPIVCLLAKIAEGKIDKKIGKELVERSEALLGHFKDPKKAAKMAAEQMESELNARAIQQGRLGEALKVQRNALEGVTEPKQVPDFINKAINKNYRSAEMGNFTLFGAPFARHMEPFQTRLKRFSPMENRTVIEGIMGTKAVKNADLAGLVKGYRDSMDVIHRTMADYGILGKMPPKNSMPVDLQPARVLDTPLNEFKSDMSNLKLDYLVENTPFFHKAKGGINEMLEDFHKVVGEGAGVHPEIGKKYGLSTTDFRTHLLRSLHTDNPDAYIKFQKKYGGGNDNFMQSHAAYMRNMGEYTARYEAFGGDIQGYSKWVTQKLEEKGVLKPSERLRIKKQVNFVSGNLDNHIFLNKSYNVPFTNISVKPGLMFQAVQSAIPILLGKGAVFGATVIDPAYSAATKKEMGLKSTGRLMTFLRTGSKNPRKTIQDNRNLASRTALTIDYYADILLDGIRRNEAGTGTQSLDKFTAFALRVFGLTSQTNINRQGSLLDISYKLADVKNAPWADLDVGLRKRFRTVGIGPEDWKTIQKSDLTTDIGGEMLTPESFIETDLKMARKLSRFYQIAKEKSVPSYSSTMEMWKKESMSVGTLTGIGAQSISTFQGFTASVWENWVVPALAGESRSTYATLVAATTLLGYAQVALENTAKGETTNFEDPENIAKAFIKGGAASFFTEIVSAASVPFGGLKGYAGSTVLGVTLGTAAEVGNIIIRNGGKALDGKETSVAYDMFNLGNKFLPLQSFWLTSEMWDRYGASAIRMKLNPRKARKKIRAQKKRMREDGVEEL